MCAGQPCSLYTLHMLAAAQHVCVLSNIFCCLHCFMSGHTTASTRAAQPAHRLLQSLGRFRLLALRVLLLLLIALFCWRLRHGRVNTIIFWHILNRNVPPALTRTGTNTCRLSQHTCHTEPAVNCQRTGAKECKQTQTPNNDPPFENTPCVLTATQHQPTCCLALLR